MGAVQRLAAFKTETHVKLNRQHPPEVGILQLLQHTVTQLDAKGMQQRSCLLERLKHGICPVAALADVAYARQDIVQGTRLLLCLLAVSFT